MDAVQPRFVQESTLGRRLVGLAKAAAGLHMAEGSRQRDQMLRPGEVGFEWSGALRLAEFEALFDLGSAHSSARRARRVGP